MFVIAGGIPFAAPPNGNNRWRPPQPVTPWTATKELLQTDPGYCPQWNGTALVGDEDCLYLNVYAPVNASNLPVALWIYGGSFVSGGLNYKGELFGFIMENGYYDPRKVVEATNVIIVAANYRLGGLGFLALDALKQQDGTTGNYGTLDQVAALKWIKNNIAAFGGNVNKVSIFGESAGAMSVCWHLASPRSAGLFHGAVMESGTCDNVAFFVSYDKSVSWGNVWSNGSGCAPTDLTCLRQLPWQVAASVPFGLQPDDSYYLPPFYPGGSWAPVIDGAALTDVPLTVIQSGQGNNVPLIIGTNKDEGVNFVSGIPSSVPDVTLPLTLDGFNLTLFHFFKNATLDNLILAQYPMRAGETDYDMAFARFLNDWLFACSSRRAAQAVANNGQKAYGYVFTGPLYVYLATYGADKVQHGAEVPYVFNNPPVPWDADGQTLSNHFVTLWTNFYKTGNPNTPTAPTHQWPEFNGTLLNISLPLGVVDNYLSTTCDFWDSFYAKGSAWRNAVELSSVWFLGIFWIIVSRFN